MMIDQQRRSSLQLPPHYGDPSQSVVLERQAHIIHQLDRMESKIDRIPITKPKRSRRSSPWMRFLRGINDPKSIMGLLFLAMLLTGDLTLGEIKDWLLK